MTPTTILETHDEVDRIAWDRRLTTTPAGSFFQSTSYGELCRTQLREEPRYARVMDDGRVLGQLLWFRTYWARDRVSPWPRVARAWRHVAPAHRWLSGPVVLDAASAAEVTRALLSTLSLTSDVTVGIEPIYSFPDISTGAVIHPDEWTFSVSPQATLLLDLAQPIEGLWQQVSPDGRRNVRRAMREGVKIQKLGAGSDIASFHQVYSQTYRRHRLQPKSVERLQRTRELLPDCYHMFLSEQGGVALSAQAAIVWNGVVFLSGCSVSDYALRNGLHGTDLMQWHVIEWAKSHGGRLIDWAGYSLHPSARESGINRFKAKWGGRPVTYDVYSRVRPAFRSALSWYRSHRRDPVAAS